MVKKSGTEIEGFGKVCLEIFGRNLLVSLFLAIFLNCTCLNSVVLFSTGKWLLNLGEGGNVHDPGFVVFFWTISTLVIVGLAICFAARECWQFRKHLSQIVDGSLTVIPYIEIDAPRLGLMVGESEFVCGQALGNYLQTKLSLRGYTVPRVFADDLSYYVVAEKDGFRMKITIMGYLSDKFLDSLDDDDNSDVPPGTPLELWVHVDTNPRSYWNWSRFRFVDRTELVVELNERILAILKSDPDITIIRCLDELPVEPD